MSVPFHFIFLPHARCRFLPSLPTRRSSDLIAPNRAGWGYPFAGKLSAPAEVARHRLVADAVHAEGGRICMQILHTGRDRKSTRLNSSHLVISYAVFSL